MAKKALYHQQLVKMGDVQVYVDSDPIESTYKRGSKFVALKINGEDKTYSPELVSCAEAFRGYKGKTVTVRASGSDYQGATDAKVTILSVLDGAAPPPQQQQPPPQQHYQQPPPQQQPPRQQPPTQTQASNGKMPIHGPTVGMAVNKACEYLMSHGEPLTAKNIHPIASEIIRVTQYLEKGNLAPKQGAQQPAQPATPPPPPPPQQPAPQPASDQPAEDDVPF